MSKAKNLLVPLAQKAGVEVNGPNPWDLQIHDDRIFNRIMREGSIGFGEGYMDGWWDTKDLPELINRVMKMNIEELVNRNVLLLLQFVGAVLINKANPRRAFEVGEKHYDAGNELYQVMLDSRMVYTCGYWKDATTLDEAQEAKLDLVCKKIGLKKGDRVLDIGCGWGSFLKFAAEKYGARGVGVTVSKEQMDLAKKNVEGYDVEIRMQDYRAINETEKFDHIISLGMFEHVGYNNYRDFFKVAHKNLKDDGLFLLHTIGNNKSVHTTDPWIEKYIFPNSMLPSIAQIGKAHEKLFVMEDWHNFSAYYEKTLQAWFNNFDAGWSKLKANYDDRFYRMWKFYLLSCAGLFRARKAQLWQIVFSKKGVPGGYQSIR
jgi:cyclopropane-fatty-acyl-phospholipid synthase